MELYSTSWCLNINRANRISRADSKLYRNTALSRSINICPFVCTLVRNILIKASCWFLWSSSINYNTIECCRGISVCGCCVYKRVVIVLAGRMNVLCTHEGVFKWSVCQISCDLYCIVASQWAEWCKEVFSVFKGIWLLGVINTNYKGLKIIQSIILISFIVGIIVFGKILTKSSIHTLEPLFVFLL